MPRLFSVSKLTAAMVPRYSKVLPVDQSRYRYSCETCKTKKIFASVSWLSIPYCQKETSFVRIYTSPGVTLYGSTYPGALTYAGVGTVRGLRRLILDIEEDESLPLPRRWEGRGGVGGGIRYSRDNDGAGARSVDVQTGTSSVGIRTGSGTETGKSSER